jgi:hypothetical protein
MPHIEYRFDFLDGAGRLSLLPEANCSYQRYAEE